MISINLHFSSAADLESALDSLERRGLLSGVNVAAAPVERTSAQDSAPSGKLPPAGPLETEYLTRIGSSRRMRSPQGASLTSLEEREAWAKIKLAELSGPQNDPPTNDDTLAEGDEY